MGGSITGGCLCGAVRYRVAAFQEGATVCHCRTCQQSGGGPFMVFAPVAHADFAVTHGALTLYRSSDIAERGFCASCGSPLTYRGFASDHVSVAVGTPRRPRARRADRPTRRRAGAALAQSLARHPQYPARRLAEGRRRKTLITRRRP